MRLLKNITAAGCVALAGVFAGCTDPSYQYQPAPSPGLVWAFDDSDQAVSAPWYNELEYQDDRPTYVKDIWGKEVQLQVIGGAAEPSFSCALVARRAIALHNEDQELVRMRVQSLETFTALSAVDFLRSLSGGFSEAEERSAARWLSKVSGHEAPNSRFTVRPLETEHWLVAITVIPLDAPKSNGSYVVVTIMRPSLIASASNRSE